MFRIFWDFLMDEQLFFPPQVKQSVINNIKVGYIASQVTKRLNT